jgi:hypothetical protein
MSKDLEAVERYQLAVEYVTIYDTPGARICTILNQTVLYRIHGQNRPL